jgi:predicted SPOUT superfamily RNA methylase MTH1
MKRYTGFFAALMLIAPAAAAYQVTGPVLDVTDTKIVVQKDKEKWEIGRDKNTTVKGDLKKGSRVTVQYNMTATEIEVKDTAKKDAKEAKKDGKKGN